MLRPQFAKFPMLEKRIVIFPQMARQTPLDGFGDVMYLEKKQATVTVLPPNRMSSIALVPLPEKRKHSREQERKAGYSVSLMGNTPAVQMPTGRGACTRIPLPS